MKKILFIILSAAFAVNAFASYSLDSVSDSASVAGKYLTLGVGAAAAGMGNAYTGSAQDAVAMFWNPAGMINMKTKDTQNSVFLAHNGWLMNSEVDNIAIARYFKNIGIFGFGLTYFNSGDMDRYDINAVSGEPIDLGTTFSNYALCTSLSYANSLDENINFGIVLKYISDYIDSSAATAFAFDLGLKYNVTPLKGLSLNVVARNFGGQFGTSVLSKELVFGVDYSFLIADWGINAEYDAVGKIKNNAVHRFGLEVKTPYTVVLRTGYYTDDTEIHDGFKNFTFGAGIKINKLYSLDISLSPYSTLGFAYQASIGADF
jgi:hypothetical protein